MQLFQTDGDVRWNLILNTIMASWRKCLIRTYWRTRKQSSSSFSWERINDTGILLLNKWTGFWWAIAGQAIGTFSLIPWEMRKIAKVDALVQSFYVKRQAGIVTWHQILQRVCSIGTYTVRHSKFPIGTTVNSNTDRKFWMADRVVI